MKKANATAIAVISLALLTALPAEAGGRRYYNGGNNGGVNGWAAAAIGAVVGVAVGAALTHQPSANYYGQPAPVYQANPNIYYSQPAPVYQANPNVYYAQPAPVYQANPNVYYVPQQVCQTSQVPVFNQFGQTVGYKQVCAN